MLIGGICSSRNMHSNWPTTLRSSPTNSHKPLLFWWMATSRCTVLRIRRKFLLIMLWMWMAWDFGTRAPSSIRRRRSWRWWRLGTGTTRRAPRRTLWPSPWLLWFWAVTPIGRTRWSSTTIAIRSSVILCSVSPCRMPTLMDRIMLYRLMLRPLVSVRRWWRLTSMTGSLAIRCRLWVPLRLRETRMSTSWVILLLWMMGAAASTTGWTSCV